MIDSIFHSIYSHFVKLRLWCLYLVIVLVSVCAKAGTDPMYSQYMFNMTNLNPAYVGSRAATNMSLLYRRQWLAVDGAPNTGVFTLDTRQPGSNAGYGLQVYSDMIGVQSFTGIRGFYSYRIAMDKSFLSFGLSAGCVNSNAQYSKTHPYSTGDKALGQDVNNFFPTAGFGVIYATKEFYVGFSAPSLLQTTADYSANSPVRIAPYDNLFLTGGYIFTVSDIIKLKPSILLKRISGAALQYDFNVNAWWNDIIGLGLSFRTNDSFVALFEFQASQQLRFGYAYDYATSQISQYTSGTHELMIRYELPAKKFERILSPRYY